MRAKTFAAYLLAALFALAAFEITWLIHPYLNVPVPFLVYLAGLLMLAWYAGQAPAHLATGIYSLLVAYYFLPPTHSFLVEHSPDLAALGLFTLLAALMANCSDRFRKSHDRAVRDQRQLERLHELSGRLVSETSFDAMLRDVLQATMELLCAEKGTIQLYDCQDHVLRLIKQVGLHEKLSPRFDRVPIGSLSCGTAFEKKERVMIENVVADRHFCALTPLFQELGVVGAQSTPLFGPEGNVFGVLTTFWSKPYGPSQADLRLLDLYAHQAARILVFKRDEEHLRQANEALEAGIKTAEEALQEREVRLRLAQQAAGIGTFDWNLQTGINVWTPELEALYGLARGEFTRTQVEWEQLVHPDDRKRAVQLVQQAFDTGEPTQGEWRTVWPDGSIHWLTGRWQVFKDHCGSPIRMIGVNFEITDRKRAETLKEERYRHMFEHAGTGIATASIDGHFLDCNSAYCTMLGYTVADLQRTKKVFSDLVYPDDRAENMAQVRRLLAQEVPSFEIENRYVHKDGHPVWVHKYISLLRDEAGRPQYFIALVTDMSERRRVEMALRESENRLRLALVGGRMGTWAIDLPTGTVRWDAKQHEIFGLRPDQSPRTMKEFYELVHQDDRRGVQEAAALVEQSGMYFSHEFRIVRPDGAIRWVAGEGSLIRDAQGCATRMIGVNYDVTERKEAQVCMRHFAEELEQEVTARTQELVQSQQQLRALATELNLAEFRERQRLAAELHDHLQQLLVFGKLQIGQGKRHVAAIPAAASVLKRLDDLLAEALTYTRTLVAELSPPALRDHGVGAALHWLGEYMQKQQFTVDVRLPEKEIPRLPDDQAALLFHSVRELLINSAKYAGRGRATVEIVQLDGQLRVVVRDEGAGFDMATVAGAATPQPAGGLSSKFGLFSIQERMRALGGSFSLDTAPGKGTAATILLPLTGPVKQASVSGALSGPPSPTTHQPVRLTRPTGKAVPVLLVDDHVMVRQGLRAMLEDYPDLTVIGEAVNGEEAVTAVERLRPRIVVMDINMPKTNGIDATAAIKARYPETIVIGLSVNAERDNQDKMRAAGASRLLTKEAAVEHLYSTIQETLRPELPAHIITR